MRYRFAASRLLIKYMAAAALGTMPEYLDLAYRLGGRPYLRGFDQLDLSLSHTGEMLAVGLNRTGRIGVDVELADRFVRLDLLEPRMLTPAEAQEIAELPESRRNAHALRLWTLKEAYSKALGQDCGSASRSSASDPAAGCSPPTEAPPRAASGALPRTRSWAATCSAWPAMTRAEHRGRHVRGDHARPGLPVRDEPDGRAGGGLRSRSDRLGPPG
ncbi:4'-phosphopantetheinyl transferase superfamily protein [Streptomyces sp. M10(2022)]